MTEAGQKSDKSYYVYILRCRDGSLYTGITTDIQRRFSQHVKGTSKGGGGAKYTSAKHPLYVEALWQALGRSSALKLEYAIKALPKLEKEDLIKEKLTSKVDFSLYPRLAVPQNLQGTNL